MYPTHPIPSERWAHQFPKKPEPKQLAEAGDEASWTPSE